MNRYAIAVIVGSLRKESFNSSLATAVTKLAPPDLTLARVEIGNLPLYNQDDDLRPTPAVQRLRDQIRLSRGLLFVTPEYNRSISGVLKNALDHGSRPYGQNSWAGRPAGILGVSEGPIGTAAAQQHLRNVLASLDVPTMALPEIYMQAQADLFDASGNLGERHRLGLQQWMDAYAMWVCRHAPQRSDPVVKAAF